MPAKRILIALLVPLATGCGEGAGGGDDVADETPAVVRPATRTDTLLIAGMPREVRLERFEAPAGFPLPFTTYVPGGMAAEIELAGEDGLASIQFIGELGFVHVVVHPPEVGPQEALGVIKAYSASHGVPVSKGIEPIPSPDVATRMAWAAEAYTFRYQAGGRWFAGTIGVSSHAGRLFHVVHHYPDERGAAFGPRAALIMETWRWADGSKLAEG